MSKLKLNTKDFSGETTTSYKVMWYLDDVDVSLKLLINFNGNLIEADEVTTKGVGFLYEEMSMEQKRENVLKEAEQKWSLQLTKAILKTA